MAPLGAKLPEEMRPGRLFFRTAFAGVLALASIPGSSHAALVGSPLIVTQPAAFAAYQAPVPVSMYATCETVCSAQVFWRITSPSQDTFGTGDPPWSSLVMGRGSTIALGTQMVINFFATLPGADTRGLDYVLKVTDGSFTAYSPGVPGIVAGIRTGWYHVYVNNPAQVASAPVANASFRSAIPISADATCARTCTATLFYRRTGLFGPAGLETGDPHPDSVSGADAQWQAVAMSLDSITQVGSVGADRYHFAATIPSQYVDTRGVDYAIRVTDGTTRAYAPGTSYVGYYLPQDGLRIGWYHVFVAAPAIAVHTQTVYVTSASEPVTLSVQVLCWTGSCSAQMSYDSFGGPVRTLDMALSSTAYLSDARLLTYTATVPASDVSFPTLSYWFRATDGYTTAYSPGTIYNGYYASIDGVQAGSYFVDVV